MVIMLRNKATFTLLHCLLFMLIFGLLQDTSNGELSKHYLNLADVSSFFNEIFLCFN